MTDHLIRLAHFHAAYADCVDSDALEQWPQFFTEGCHYKVTTWDNWRAGYVAGVMYLQGKGMMRDRIAAMRKANVFEAHRYRHITGLPARVRTDGGAIHAATPFTVYRIMRTGATDLFATGQYIDTFAEGGEHGVLLRERLVVCDSSRLDTLMVIPL